MNSQDNIGIRGALLWQPNDNLSITFSGDFNLQDPICCAQIYARVGTTQRALSRQYAALIARFPGYQVPSTDPFDRLPGVSKWSFAWGGEYNVPANIFGRQGQVYFGYDGNYRSKFSSNASRSIYTDIEGYSVHNIRFGFRTEGFDIYGWVRNAFDQDYFESLAVTPGNTGLFSAQLADPRTFGGTIRLSF